MIKRRAGRSIAAVLLAFFFAVIGRAETLDRDGLRIHWEKMSEGRATAAARLVEEQGRAIESRLGAAPPRPLDVWLAPNDASFDRTVESLAGRPAPEWALAVAVPAARAIVVRVPRLEVATAADPGVTLAHELAHLALGRPGIDLPRWLDEGLAMWASGQRLAPADRTALARLVRSGELPKLDELARDYPPHAEDVPAAYLESLAFVEDVVRDFGEKRLRAFIAAVLRDVEVDRAFEATFDAPRDGYESRFRADLAKHYSLWRDIFERGSIWTAAAVLAIAAFARYWLRRRRTLRAMGEEESSTPSPE